MRATKALIRLRMRSLIRAYVARLQNLQVLCNISMNREDLDQTAWNLS